MRPFVGDDLHRRRVRRTSSRAPTRASATPPARRWCSSAPNHFLLELFHGPTLAFKDFAMQLIGQLFQDALERRASG